jgi:predicted Zn-dependent protease
MKASIPRFWFLAVALLMVPFFPLKAQDAIVQKDGQRREGEITGVKADAIRIKIGPVETAVQMANVQSVEKVAPADFDAANELWRAGNAAGALAKLEPLTQKFSGLPTPWAERATSLLPELYISQSRAADAETAFRNFQKLYPAAGSSSDLLLARLALAKKDSVTAQAKLAPIVEAAKQTKLPAGADAVAMSQALCLMGEIQEDAGEKSEALGNYLLVTTIFKNDPSSATRAATRAEALEKEKVIVP